MPDSAETKTTETPLQPTNLQTPDLMNETAANGEKMINAGRNVSHKVLN